MIVEIFNVHVRPRIRFDYSMELIENSFWKERARKWAS